MVILKAFITLERSIASAMQVEWRKAAEKVQETVHPLLETGKFAEAHYEADRLTMTGVVEEQKLRLEEFATSALLFGAHNATGTLKDVSFVTGAQKLPEGLQQALAQLSHMVEQGGGEYVRGALHDLIHAEELKARGLFKDDLSGCDLEEDDAQLILEQGQRGKKPKAFAKAEKMTLAERLNDAVIGAGRAMIDISANLTTSRLVSLGFLAEAAHRETKTYQVTEELDSRTCAVCRYLHGKTFEVVHEYFRLLSVLGTQELKSAAPWPRQDTAGLKAVYSMSAAEMQNAGYGSPPYHPGCRGVLALAGSVDEEVPLGSLAVFDMLNPLLDGTKGPAEAASMEEPVSAVKLVPQEFDGNLGRPSCDDVVLFCGGWPGQVGLLFCSIITAHLRANRCWVRGEFAREMQRLVLVGADMGRAYGTLDKRNRCSG